MNVNTVTNITYCTDWHCASWPR